MREASVTILTGLVWRHLASVWLTTVSAEILTNGPQRGSVLCGATRKRENFLDLWRGLPPSLEGSRGQKTI